MSDSPKQPRSLDPREFQKRLHHEIPISSHMKIEVVEVNETRAHVKAPLGPNINHQSTAFGGSVNAVAVASCWSLITGFVDLQGLDADYIVIQDSAISYRNPIASDFYAIAEWESSEGPTRFLETLKKKSRARATLTAKVYSTLTPGDSKTGVPKEEAATLKARFAAQLKR